MRKIIFLIFVIIFSSVSLFSETGVVKRDRASVRTGPGSIFEIIYEMARGDSFRILSRQRGWFNIEFEDQAGFTSEKVISEKSAINDIFSKMGDQETDLKVSRHGMSAGVKGFAAKYTAEFGGEKDFLDNYVGLKLDADKFKYFKQVTYHDFTLKKVADYPIPDNNAKDHYSVYEEGIGLGIAARISEIGLLNNSELTEYVNFIGYLIVESSDAYDVGFKFFILDSDLVNAYACPGGIVFITRGFLELISDEAELVCVLAHEVAHVSRHHGMQELKQRKHHIAAEDAFAEMDEELEELGGGYDPATKEIETELEDIALEAYETIFNGRLAEYEEEADYLAMIYSLRAGYEYSRLPDLLKRMQAFETQSTNEHYSSEQISDRLIALEENIKKIKISHKIVLMDKQYRWQNMKEKLN
jgi:hypothetical protein